MSKNIIKAFFFRTRQKYDLLQNMIDAKIRMDSQ